VTEEQVNERNMIENTRNRRIAQATVALIGVAILISFTIWYTSYSQRQDDLRWCALMVGLDNRYQSLPPDSDPAALDFATKIHDLRRSLHCPDSEKA